MSIRLKDTIYDLINKATKDGSGNTITSTYLKLSGGTMTGTIISSVSGAVLQTKYDGSNYNTIVNHNNGNISLSAATGSLYLGYTNTSAIYCRGSYVNIDSGNYTTYAAKASHTHSYAGSSSAGGPATTVVCSASTSDANRPIIVTNESNSLYYTTKAKLNYSTGRITAGALTITDTNAVKHIEFSRGNFNYITLPVSGSLAIVPNGQDVGSATADMIITDSCIYPGTTNVTSLGQSSLKWKNVYATTFTGALSGNASSSTYSTYIRVTETEPTSGTYYYPIWTAGMTSGSDYTPRANDGFRYYTLEGTADASGTALLFLGNSTATGTAGNKQGRLGIYGPSSYYAYLYGPDTATGTFYFPNTGGTLVTHEKRGTAVGTTARPVYIASSGRAAACTIAAGSGNSNRCLMVTNGSNEMYYTSTITGNYLNGALISKVSDETAVRHTCENLNGAVSIYVSTNRGLYDTTNSAWIIYLTKAADHVYVSKWASKGSTTAPVYFNSSGEPTAGSTYAGGTKVTLNGTAKGASTASFYAPTGAGTSGQFLQSTGGVPGWVTLSYWSSTTSRTANTVLAAPNGSAGAASFRKLVAADLPTMYWANVAISGSSSTTKAPTLASVSLGASGTAGYIYMLRDSANYIKCGTTDGSGGYLAVVPNGQSPSAAASDLIVKNGQVYPGTTNVTSLGTSSYYWSNTYSTIVTTPKVTNSAAVVINSGSEVQMKYNDTSTSAVVLSSTAFKPFTSATSKLMLGNSTSLWKGLYLGVNTSTALNNVGINYCNTSGIIVGSAGSSGTSLGIYATGSIFLRGGCTASTTAGTALTSSGTGLVIDSAGNASATNFTSSVATGTRPLIVTSTTKCTNLNSDFWDGYHLSIVTALPSSPATNTIYVIT